MFHSVEMPDNEALIWPLIGEDERLEGLNVCQMYIDLSSFVIPLPATHKRWSDLWDVRVAINERRKRVRGVSR